MARQRYPSDKNRKSRIHKGAKVYPPYRKNPDGTPKLCSKCGKRPIGNGKYFLCQRCFQEAADYDPAAIITHGDLFRMRWAMAECL